jgi:succinoglycan biosynthesis transport protein ExoP
MCRPVQWWPAIQPELSKPSRQKVEAARSVFFGMSSKSSDAQTGGMSLGDIYFTLFRHKWKILLLSASGILAALALLLFRPPLYESKTKLDILYVVENKSFNPPGNGGNTVSLNERGSSIIQTEMEILQSGDVVMEAVQTIGAGKILARAGGGSNTNAAAGLIAKKLNVESYPGSSVIQVSLQHPDPEIVQSILSEIIARYFKKHAEIHQGSVMFGDFSIQETNRLYKEIAQTKEELKNARGLAGVFSVDTADKSYDEQISQIRNKLFAAQTELVERREVSKEMSNALSATLKSTNVAAEISNNKIDAYRNICTRLGLLQKKEQELLLQYTDQSVPIKDLRAQIAENEASKKKLETEDPRLTSLGASLGAADHPALNMSDNTAQISALEARIKILNSQLSQIQSDAAKIDESREIISELKQRVQREEAEFEYFQRNLEQARIDTMIGAGKAPNIGIIQSPSTPVKKWSEKLKKMAAILAAGGMVAGLGLAFLIEMFFDRTLKRPVEIEAKLGLPLFISIPDFTQNGYPPAQIKGKNPLLLTETSGKNASENAALGPWSRQHPLRRFCDGLRDRLIVHFEVTNVTHNPKLVAVTSCARGAGVSSVATGLAASLSETGDGNVLLVDMNVEGGAAQQFYKGKPGCGLDAALEVEARKNALIQENLYVAAEPMHGSDKLPSVLPKHLTGLIPKLRASDYDYIIFDMPAVTQTSMTPRLARLMDMVLLVIESEKTNQEVAKKVISLLGESKATVTTVLNKTRSYVPSKLHQEFLNDA